MSGQMLMPDGTVRERPAYLDKPQSQWTEAEREHCARSQQEVLDMQARLTPNSGVP